MTSNIDPPTIIRKLAEAEWVRKSLPDFEGDLPDSIGTQSMEVPLASLRVEHQHGFSHAQCVGEHICHLTILSYLDIVDCKTRGWVPEPDVVRACFNILVEQAKRGISWVLDYNPNSRSWRVLKNEPGDYEAFDYVVEEASDTPTEAVLRAGEAWLDKKMKELP